MKYCYYMSFPSFCISQILRYHYSNSNKKIKYIYTLHRDDFSAHIPEYLNLREGILSLNSYDC